MYLYVVGVLIMGALSLSGAAASAQSAAAIKGATPLVAIADEPPAKLIVDPPLAEPLSRKMVFIQ